MSLNGSQSTLTGSESTLTGSQGTLTGSQGTLNGSVKSSKSSGTYFGSCISSETIGTFKTVGSSETIGTIGTFRTAKSSDTIGSFRTAHSGSLSTLYFSAKSYGEEGDSNTLNWTMNYSSFDELSDTSTLIGDPEASISIENQENFCLTESESTLTLNEEEDQVQQSEMIQTSDSTITTVDFEPMNSDHESNQSSSIQPKSDHCAFLEKDKFLNITLILIVAVISSSIHLIFAYAQVPTTPWILVFWRSVLQISVGSGVLIWSLRKSSRIRFKNLNLRMHLIIGFLGFISIMFWLDISQKKLLTSGTSSIMYFVMPLIVFFLEIFVRKPMPFSLWSSIGIILFWSSALLAFSSQLWSKTEIPWRIYSLDPAFAWPVPVGDSSTEDIVLGHVLSTFAITATASYLLVISFDNKHGWPSILLCQGFGGLLASLIGKHKFL